jgi:hypothetical protein
VGSLSNNRCLSIIASVWCGNVFTEPLPSNGHMRHNIFIVDYGLYSLYLQTTARDAVIESCNVSKAFRINLQGVKYIRVCIHIGRHDHRHAMPESAVKRDAVCREVSVIYCVSFL